MHGPGRVGRYGGERDHGRRASLTVRSFPTCVCTTRSRAGRPARWKSPDRGVARRPRWTTSIVRFSPSSMRMDACPSGGGAQAGGVRVADQAPREPNGGRRRGADPRDHQPAQPRLQHHRLARRGGGPGRACGETWRNSSLHCRRSPTSSSAPGASTSPRRGHLLRAPGSALVLDDQVELDAVARIETFVSLDLRYKRVSAPQPTDA